MKKIYTKPELDVVEFNHSNIIVTRMELIS